jgi:hypothetical protein
MADGIPIACYRRYEGVAMSRYQIRTPEDKSLEDVLKEMVAGSWEAAKVYFKEGAVSGRDPENFRKSIFSAVMPYVRTFRLCGLSNICLDEVQSAPLAEQAFDVNANPWDLVYHIFFKGDAEEFVDMIAFEALESIKRLVKPDDERLAFAAVEAALIRVLGKYLYYSPVCGQTELCVFSNSAPIAPLGRH